MNEQIQTIMNIDNNLRLYLNFLDDLDLVKILAVTNDWDRRIVIMGAVSGKKRLVDLLKQAEIDHFMVGGDSFAMPPSLPSAYETTPQKMVQNLDEGFRTVDETRLRILKGEQLTEDELSFRMPLSLRVFSSSATVSDGLQRVQKWFENQTQQK